MPFNRSQLDAGILQKLGIVASKFMVIMAQKVSQNRLPKKITEHTSADSPQKKGGKYSIDVVIDTSEDAAPMAGAFEWGSGLHGEKDAKYPIQAKDPSGNLVFWWERGQKLFVGHALPFGHPGVKARPYIEPSIKEIRKPFKKMFAEEFKRQYLMGTPKVTVISAKK